MKKLFPVVCLFSWFIAAHSFADSATWNLSPSDSRWNRADNWTPATVPNGPADTATFAGSNVTDISFSAKTTISQVVFTEEASAYHMSIDGPFVLKFVGPGLTNTSDQTQARKSV